ncbi:DMT family transporter [Robertkochia solimangrovi]|uniref:DMT family transporter n=1 Tax=Robertkochia solimangrovi TaxID=2213046 RepID=UPI00118056A7|nr:EamA family transporter [Robertkochia solimangrovi]TRZ45801.1 permease [Robertkochia solimangrovi]
MNNDTRKWVYLIVLSLIWGSSYILIKKGLGGLTPLQLGAVRIIFSTIFLFLIGFRSLFRIKKKEWPWVGLSALCGTFIPVFLFAFAETEIDSNIASVLNSLVPLFAIIMGVVLFRIRFVRIQLFGVLFGLIGAGLLILQGASLNPDQNYFYSLLVIIAAILYAANANIIKTKLQDVSAMSIAVGNFAFMVLPAIVLLCFSGIFETDEADLQELQTSLMYIAILAVFGTGMAKILFNRLIQISDAVFSTSVTYLIPVVGVFWGVLDGEHFGLGHLFGAIFILGGVYLVNKGK